MPGVSMDNVSDLNPAFEKAYQKSIQMERKPIQAMAAKKDAIDTKVKLFNEIIQKVDTTKKSLSKLGNPRSARELSLSSGDDKVVAGSLEPDAEPGKYELEVLQLAKPARAISNGFPDRDQTKIGSGYFTFSTPDGEKEVFVDNENATLDGMVKIINHSGLGLRASVIRDHTDPDNPFRLAIMGDQIGSDGQLDFPDFYFVDGEQDFFIDNQQPATNAVVRFQGFEVESPTNEVKDLIPGVNVKLRGISEPGRPVTLDIDHDLPKAKLKVKELVDNLNGVLSFIQTQSTMDDKTDTTKTLGSEYGIRVSEDRIRQVLQPLFIPSASSEISGIQTMGDLGIQFTRKGTLNLDEKKLDAALNNNFESVADFLAGDGVSTGLANKLDRALSTIAGGPSAVLSSQEKTYADRSHRLQQDIESKEKQAAHRSEELKMKLSKAQAALNQMESQSAAISAQLGSLPSH